MLKSSNLPKRLSSLSKRMFTLEDLDEHCGLIVRSRFEISMWECQCYDLHFLAWERLPQSERLLIMDRRIPASVLALMTISLWGSVRSQSRVIGNSFLFCFILSVEWVEGYAMHEDDSTHCLSRFRSWYGRWRHWRCVEGDRRSRHQHLRCEGKGCGLFMELVEAAVVKSLKKLWHE
jgi:hypothetical protein